MNQQYEKVPNMISGKDLDYLTDMFEWNYIAYKKAMFAMENVEKDDIHALLLEVASTFKNHMQTILNVLEQGGCESE